jgi:DNA invertase Pin-like site-specific DNA recombinase
MSKKVAIYARYSSDMQSEASIEDQVRLAELHCKRQGLTVIKTYSDAAVSGASMMRSGIQQLMQDATQGKFDLVVTEALDRLSRDQADIAAIYKRLQFAGVGIFTLSEGEINTMHIGLKGTMNQLFLKDLADKTRRGLRGRIEKGKSGGGLCYGYTVVKQYDANGEAIRGDRVIHPEQAAIVQRIFKDYAEGKSPKAIAHQLNKEGVTAPSGKSWGQSTINGNRERGNGILNNELYIGLLTWNRQRYIKNPDTGTRVSRMNPESEWIRKDVPELRILDQELWDKVKEKQGAIRKQNQQADHVQARPKYLFSYLLKCGCCGGGFSKISKSTYGCSNARNKGTCSNRLGMNQDVLEQAILTSLKNHLMDSELCKVFCDEYTRHLNEVSRHRHQIMAKYRAEYAKLLQVKERIIKAVTEGWDTPDMKAELENNYKRRQELETLIEQKEDTAPVMLHPSMAEYYRQEVGQLISSLNQPETRSEAAQLLRKLIDKILLTPNDTGDALRVDLHGDLAGILHMATHCKALSEEDHPLVHQISLMTGYQEKEKDTMQKPKNALAIKEADVSRSEWLRGLAANASCT